MKETVSENITMLIDDTGRYIEAKTELWKLKAVDKTANIVSSFVAQLAFILVAILGIISLNIGVALLLGAWLGETYYGFFIVAGIYALLCLILYLSRRQIIKTPVYNALVNKILK